MKPLVLLALLVSFFITSSASTVQPKQKLVVILLDGFRWDYVQQQEKELPAFRQFHKEGVRAKWVQPIFPSLSYPSWTTLSTGLYAENHNIIGNYFYDSYNRATFELFNTTSTSIIRWWQDAEPIWITATNHGRKVATFLWNRSDIPFRGILPAYYKGFIKTKGWESLEQNTMEAIRKLEDGFDLIMIYNEHIDNKGHQFGPTSTEVKRAVREIDNVLHKFLHQLKERRLDDEVNIMIVSDHGMAFGGAGSGVQYIDIGLYVDTDDVVFIIDRGAFTSIAPVPSRANKVYERLKQMPGVDVYRRDDIPDEFHYKNGRYVQEIIVLAKPGFFIQGREHPKYLPKDPPGLIWNGFHGYEPSNPDMRTIFMAKGPAFKKHYEGNPIKLVDIYQLYARILSVPAQPHNGTWANVQSYLVGRSSSLSSTVLSIVAAFVTAINAVSFSF